MWKGCGRYTVHPGEGREWSKDKPWTGRSPGGGVVISIPPTVPSRQPPLRRWKFARLTSSSHPPSDRVLFASLSVGRLLDLGASLSHTGLCAVRCAACHGTSRMSLRPRRQNPKKPRSVRHLAHTTRVNCKAVTTHDRRKESASSCSKACLAGVTPPSKPMAIEGALYPQASAHTSVAVSTAKLLAGFQQLLAPCPSAKAQAAALDREQI